MGLVALQARIPGSKSLTNRALLCAAGAGGRSLLRRPLASDDTLAFAGGLRALGYQVGTQPAGPGEDEAWFVIGTGQGPSMPDASVICRDAGTAARFLPALAATGHGRFRFDGTDQLRRRPLGPLLRGLEELGARVTRETDRDLPFELLAGGLRGGEVVVAAGSSSQYVSGLLLAAPLMEAPLSLRTTELASRPYVEMTLALMRRFGVEPEGTAGGTITVPVGGYQPRELTIEPDASTASYFFAAAALTGRTVTVPALGAGSAQGDLAFVELLETMGAEVRREAEATTVTGPRQGLRGGFTFDMNEISDTMMTLAALAPYADRPTTITGVGHTRHKESDRVAVTAANLRACGVAVEEGEDWLRIEPGRPRPATVACHRDHRIAMSFSVLGLGAPGLELDDPDCVQKTFPDFHQEFARLFR